VGERDRVIVTLIFYKESGTWLCVPIQDYISGTVNQLIAQKRKS